MNEWWSSMSSSCIYNSSPDLLGFRGELSISSQSQQSVRAEPTRWSSTWKRAFLPGKWRDDWLSHQFLPECAQQFRASAYRWRWRIGKWVCGKWPVRLKVKRGRVSEERSGRVYVYFYEIIIFSFNIPSDMPQNDYSYNMNGYYRSRI